MARYRKIDPRIWNDSKFASLSHEGQRLFLYILTHPSMTSLGAFRSSRLGLLEELGLDPKEFGEAFDEPLRKGLFKYDPKACLIFAPNFLKYNPPENPNVVTGWAGALDLIPECSLKLEVLLKAEECVNAGKDGVQKAFAKSFSSVLETLSKEFAEPFEKSLPIQEQEQEQDIYIHNKQHTQVCNEGSAAEDGVYSDCFDESSFDPDEVIDAPIKVQAAQAQLEHFDSVADNEPLSLAQLITGCKQLGIKLSHTTKTEAIASRETITKEVLRECAKAWKGTNTGTGYFVGILENASKDVNTVMPREKRELGPDTITDKQASFFASKLVRDSGFCSKFGKGYQDYNVFASKVAANIRNPRHFDEYKPYMERIGLLGGEQ